jgi:hypothetical protein
MSETDKAADSTGTSTNAAQATDPRYRRLRVFNLLVGLALLAETAVILLLNKPFSLPLTLSYLPPGAPNVTLGKPFETVQVLSLGVGFCVALFLACAALDHLLVGTVLRRWYERQLDRRANYARWIEYTFSSSLMIALIVALVGVRDLGAIVAIIGVNGAMILFGLLMERKEVPGNTDWSAFWFSSAVGLVPWVISIFYFVHASPPGFVWAIVVFQFILFFSFALNMALQYRQIGRWKDYVAGEYTYIVLSLVAKSLLAWLIFANVIVPARGT